MYAGLDRVLAISINLSPQRRVPQSPPGVFGIQLRQLPQDLLGALVLYLRRLNRHFHDLVAAFALARVHHALLAQTELLAIVRALRHLEQRSSVDGGHLDLGPQPPPPN